MPDQPLPASRRRWFRISVRALLLLVLLIGCWLGWMVRAARIQHEAVEAIQEAGGRIMYDWEWENDFPMKNEGPRVPKWLVDRLGIDYFGAVVYVEFNVFDTYVMVKGKDAGFDAARLQSYRRRFDAALAQVGRLRRLEELKLSSSEVTDAGLKHLMGLTALKKLELGSTQVTDAGVQELQRALPNLEIVR
jgi:hypothetical protein